MKRMNKVASSNKIGFHKEKLRKYLNGEVIFPVTLEFDLTSQCTRLCKDCPSSRSEFRHNVDIEFVENIFDSFEGQTEGLLLTGGEPTMSPLFAKAVKMARDKGFVNIAVVTNGSLLHQGHIMDALAEHASTIRISMYDWDDEACGDISPILEKIESLRKFIDSNKSPLKIGISALTSSERLPKLTEVADQVMNAGAHWIYYHPMCYGWSTGDLKQYPQKNVLETIREYQSKRLNGFQVFISNSRYADTPLEFDSYHAAHFLVVVGANRMNYLGAEVKYQDRFSINNLTGAWDKNFLRNPQRLQAINSYNSLNYPALHSRHRGVLYNDYIDKIIEGKIDIESVQPVAGEVNEFLFPYIL
jgi:MoaA/NifB/PqqE/SkfB family radical SAM enzyme